MISSQISQTCCASWGDSKGTTRQPSQRHLQETDPACGGSQQSLGPGAMHTFPATGRWKSGSRSVTQHLASRLRNLWWPSSSSNNNINILHIADPRTSTRKCLEGSGRSGGSGGSDGGHNLVRTVLIIWLRDTIKLSKPCWESLSLPRRGLGSLHALPSSLALQWRGGHLDIYLSFSVEPTSEASFERTVFLQVVEKQPWVLLQLKVAFAFSCEPLWKHGKHVSERVQWPSAQNSKHWRQIQCCQWLCKFSVIQVWEGNWTQSCDLEKRWTLPI